MATGDDPKLFDVRTLEQRLRRGLISRKDFERFLKALPDRADNAQAAPHARVTDEPRESGAGADADDAEA